MCHTNAQESEKALVSTSNNVKRVCLFMGKVDYRCYGHSQICYLPLNFGTLFLQFLINIFNTSTFFLTFSTTSFSYSEIKTITNENLMPFVINLMFGGQRIRKIHVEFVN